MNPIRFFQRLSVIALCAASAMSVFAQAPLTPPTPGGLHGASTRATPAALPPSAARGFSCEVPASQLEEAVAIIAQAAEANGFEMPTTLFAPDAAELKVPRLKLRSVTPSGALSLLAAAADCAVEQVVAPDNTSEISGWMFRARPLQPGYAEGGFGGPYIGRSMPGAGFDPAAAAGGPPTGGLFSPGQTPGNAPPSADTPPFPPEPYSAAPTTAPRPPEPMGVIGLGGGAPPQVPVTRVYAVGLLLDESKPDAANRLQITMREVLDVAEGDEKPRTSPVLSFHDGTKLLVAKATPEAQVLIEQTLQAMKQNATDVKEKITLPDLLPSSQPSKPR